MDIGILVIWICLAVYLAIVLKTGILEKRERKWVYLLAAIIFCCSLLAMLNISLNPVLYLLDQTFGALTRMVVNL